MDILFPIDFIVKGTPLSLQASPASKIEWKKTIEIACRSVLPQPHMVSGELVSVTIYYFAPEGADVDLDNIVKPILDAMNKLVYLDDGQVRGIIVQRFDPDTVVSFDNPSDMLLSAVANTAPVVYIRVSDDPLEAIK